MGIRIIREPALVAKTGRSRVSNRTDVKSGLMVASVTLGPNSVGWPEHEVDQVVQARVAGLTPEQIRVIVRRLHAARVALAAELLAA